MPVPAAFIIVIMIWSTTPLGIQWSGAGVGYEFGVALRMLIGLVALLLITRLWRKPLPYDRHALRVYAAGGLPMFVAMTLVYWSAQYIPSGWISVIFGLSPLMTSLFAIVLLPDSRLSAGKFSGMLLGLAGLGVVFAESFALEAASWIGVAGVCASAASQSLGAVLLKKLKPSIPAISVTTGSLLLATPLFILNSLWHGLPQSVPDRTMLSIVYLAVMGTALGFPLYFYLLQNMNAERVALITLITPVTALMLGAMLNDEVISSRVWLGTALILAGLAIYEYGKYLPFSKHWRRWKQTPL
ncbi:MAG: DMT family transporter [Gammaproteobacteria bacterium]